MKKLAVALGLLGVLLAFSAPQWVVSQMEQPPIATPSEPMDRKQIQKEIMLLRLLSEMGLSRDQVATLKELISELRISQQAIIQAQLELREFLLSYQGNREDFRQTVKPFDEKIAQARKAFGEKLQNSVDRVKNLLTLKQAEILRDFLQKHAFREFDHELVMPVEPDELEFRLEVRPAPPKGWLDKLEELGERIEGWLDRRGMKLEERHEERPLLHPLPGLRCEGRPIFHFWWCERLRLSLLDGGLIASFLMEHLELWEKVLSEKLQRMSTTQI